VLGSGGSDERRGLCHRHLRRGAAPAGAGGRNGRARSRLRGLWAARKAGVRLLSIRRCVAEAAHGAVFIRWLGANQRSPGLRPPRVRLAQFPQRLFDLEPAGVDTMDRAIPQGRVQRHHGSCLWQQPDGDLRVQRQDQARRLSQHYCPGPRLVHDARERRAAVVGRPGVRPAGLRRRGRAGARGAAGRGGATTHARRVLRRRAARHGRLFRRRRGHGLRQPAGADSDAAPDGAFCHERRQVLAGQSRHAGRLPLL
jgi:hypothetical protein